MSMCDDVENDTNGDEMDGGSPAVVGSGDWWGEVVT